MSELKEFTKILIFKNTEETRSLFGDPSIPTPEIVSRGKEFKDTYPPENILTNSGWNADTGNSAILKRNLLHAMGVEESNIDGFNNSPESSGTAIIYGDKLYVTGTEYAVTTTYSEPSTPLAVGDYIFWGEDPNNLGLGGKIKKVYTGADPEFLTGALYQFEKNIVVAFDESALTATVTDATSDGTTIEYTAAGHSFVAGTEVTIAGLTPSGYNITGIIDSVAPGSFTILNTLDEVASTGTGTATSTDTFPIPQDIYYYRNSWNGKGLKTDINEGFYILIGVERDITNTRSVYPCLDPTSNGTSDDKIVNKNTGFAFNDLLRVKRISNRFKSDETTQDEEELIPCSIKRTNTFYYNRSANSSQLPNSFFTNNQQAPYWIAYFVNPYSEDPTKLDKNTTYVIEISERLPSVTSIPAANNTQLYTWASTGFI